MGAKRQDADRFIAFLRRLIKDAEQKAFLIVDNLKVHHAKKITAWAASCSICRPMHRIIIQTNS